MNKYNDYFLSKCNFRKFKKITLIFLHKDIVLQFQQKVLSMSLNVKEVLDQNFYHHTQKFILNAHHYEFYRQSSKISSYIQQIQGIIAHRNSIFHSQQLPQLMVALNYRLQQVPEQDEKLCKPLMNARDSYKKQFSIEEFDDISNEDKQSFRKSKVKKTKAMSMIQSLYDEEKTKKINESPNIDAYSLNNNINKITLKDYSLPNHQCIGCTSILYKGWKLPSLNTLETPLMILDEKNCGEKDIQNSICAGLNSKFGATILVGCTLESDENGQQIPSIRNVKEKWINEQNRKILRDMIMRSKQFYKPIYDQNKKIEVDFIKFYQLPFTQEKSYLIIPRIKVKQLRGFQPIFLQIPRKSYNSLYYYFILDQEKPFTYKQLEGSKVYYFLVSKFKNKEKKYCTPHFNSQCMSVNYQLKDIQYKSKSNQNMVENSLDNISQFWQNLSKSLKQYKYTTLLKYITNNEVPQEIVTRNKQMRLLEEDLKTSRVQFVSHNIQYKSDLIESKTLTLVMYIIGHNQSAQLVNQVMHKLKQNQKQKVTMESVSQQIKIKNVLKANDKKQFKKWREIKKVLFAFYQHQQIYPFYTQKKSGQVKLFIDFKTKQSAILGYILLDRYGSRSNFVSDKVVEEKQKNQLKI